MADCKLCSKASLAHIYRRVHGPEDVWKVAEAPIPSREGYRLVWVMNVPMGCSL